MVSERTFLMKLFLCKTIDEMREMCVKRSEELDLGLSAANYQPIQNISYQQQNPIPEAAIAQQSPSMQRIMAKHPDLIPQPPAPTTPAAAMALQKRQEIMNNAINGKKEKRSNA